MATVFAAFCVAQAAYASESKTGYVHVRTVPGVTIKLDGKFKGVVEGEEGLVIRDVPAGMHALYAFFNGHEDQHAVIAVEPSAIAVVKLRPFQPIPEHKLLGTTVKNGALWVEAIAVNATIDSKKLGWKKIPLNGEPFIAANVPAGQHKITFCNPERCIDYRASVKADDVVALVVDFGISDIQDVTAVKKNQWARLTGPAACNVELALTANGRTPDLRAPRTAAGLNGDEPGRSSRPACETLIAAVVEAAPAVAQTSQVADVSNVSSSAIAPPCVPLAGDKKGQLSIRTTPAAALYFGGKKLGETPLSRVELPAGCLELRAVSSDKGSEKMLRVEVEPDQVTVYAIEL